MKIYSEDFSNYQPWSGAVETFERIEEEGMLNDLERLIDDVYPEGITVTGLNDLLWFDSEWVYEQLGIQENEDEEE